MSSERLAWLKARQSGIGGSDIAAIAGLHPYKTAWSVYWDKVSHPSDDEAGEAARWGQLLEDVVAAEWFDRHGRHDPDGVPRCLVRSPLRRHPDHAWWVGTPDRLVCHDFTDQPDAALGYVTLAVLEVKLAGPEAWRYQWDGGATIPAWYQAQAQWYLGLTGLYEAHFAVLVEGRRLETFTLPRDDRALARLAELGERFWREHVEPRLPPQPDARRSTRDALDALYPAPADRAACVLPGDAARDVDMYLRADAAQKAANVAKATAANRLVAWLGQHHATDGWLPGDTEDDAPAVTYRPVRELDVDALAADVGADVLDGLYKPRQLDLRAAEKRLGRKALDRHRRPGTTRRINVRGSAD